MSERPFAYVCSPYRGDAEANVERARGYRKKIFDAGYAPLAPHLLFPQFLNDNIPVEREAGMEMGLQLLAGCRALVICGNEITEGMAREIKCAEELRVPVHTLDVLLSESMRNQPPAVSVSVSMDDEKHPIDGYKVIQSVKMYGMEIIIAESTDVKEQYMLWRRSLCKSFGEESYMIPIIDSDYLNILRNFIKWQSVCLDSLELERIYRGNPGTGFVLVAGDCIEGSLSGDFTGKVVAIKADALPAESRDQSHQLLLAEGGFGCAPDARGQTVFGVNIYSRNKERWSRSDILGVVDENTLPEWAREKLVILRQSAEKESVLGKLRASGKHPKQLNPKPKNHNKVGPEL